MIYGKQKDSGRFNPVNLEDGCFTRRKLYGSFFYTEQEAQKVVDSLNADNKDLIFEYRKVG